MTIIQKPGENKRGKQNPALLSHKENINPMFEASRLEGKVKNMGIKNLGHQKKKPAQPE